MGDRIGKILGTEQKILEVCFKL